MDQLVSLRRPTASLIKLVESVGTLLKVPLSKKKSSVYKTPLPSNYEDTIQLLSANFYDTISKISLLQSSDVDHEIASCFFNKMLEPGFDYENAINAGGLAVRELFNAVLLVLLRLQSDFNRAPVSVDNIVVIADGSRAAYVALDTASHLRSHGMLHILVDHTLPDTRHLDHLVQDVRRRCKNHYKVPDHCYMVHQGNINNELFSPGDSNHKNNNETTAQAQTLIESLEDLIATEECSIFVFGIQHPESFGMPQSQEPVVSWALNSEIYIGDVVLTQGSSFTRPFTEANASRTHLLYLDTLHDPGSTFLKALKYIKPGDAVVALGVFPPSTPVGDNRELRFDFGSRQGWIETNQEVLDLEPNRIGWNDNEIDYFLHGMDELLNKSMLNGRIKVERWDKFRSAAQIIMQVATEENCSSIIIQLDGNLPIISGIINFSSYTLILLK